MRNLSLQLENRRSSSRAEHHGESKISLADCCLSIRENGSTDMVLLTSDGFVVSCDANGVYSWECVIGNKETEKRSDWFNLSRVGANLVCISRSGSIATLSPESGEASHVGEFDDGIEAATWSRDNEALLLALRNSHPKKDGDISKSGFCLLCLSPQWDILAETYIDNYAPESTVSVCWHPNSQVIAVSSVDGSDNIRKIRFFAHPSLSIRAYGRKEDGGGSLVSNILSAGMTWAGTRCSQLLAAVQQKGKKRLIVFFESNGLRHREFDLREDDAAGSVVTAIQFNNDGSLLAVLLRDGGCYRVQLWSRSNYHWYLKQERRYSSGRQVSKVMFHCDNPTVLYVCFSSCHWKEYRFRWDASLIRVTQDSCIAFVVDGCTLAFTNLHEAMIPPPMFTSSMFCAAPIVEIAWVEHPTLPYAAIAILADSSICLITISDSTMRCTSVIMAKDTTIDLFSARHLVVADENERGVRILVVSCIEGCQRDRLYEFWIKHNDADNPVASFVQSWDMDRPILTVVRWRDHIPGAVVELEDGKVFIYDNTQENANKLESTPDMLGEPCMWLAGLRDPFPFIDHTRSSPLLIGMSERGSLYCGVNLVANAVSSFYVCNFHKVLAFVGSGSSARLCLLPFSDLQQIDSRVGCDGNNLSLLDAEMRKVEGDADVVAIIPNAPLLILQMPRGNLEGLHPLSLVLQDLVSMIQREDFIAAYEIMRRHKVDMNFLVDVDMQQFLQNGAAIFLAQITNMDHVNSFLSCLKNNDCTTLQYKVPRWIMRQSERPAIDFSEKVNLVCQRMRSILLTEKRSFGTTSTSSGCLDFAILTTLAKEVPPRLQDALTLMREEAIMQVELESRTAEAYRSSEVAQKYIRHLTDFVDCDKLFAAALGMYDWDIAVFVAQHSAMDPYRYRPLLHELRSFPRHFGRFKADSHLQVFESALTHLADSRLNNETLADSLSPCNDFEVILDFIKQHNLFKAGLKLFRDNPERGKVLRILGDHLFASGQSKPALAVYLNCQPPEISLAIQAARQCFDWKTVFILKQREGSETLKNSFVNKIAEEVAGNGKSLCDRRRALFDAAHILLDYGEDIEGAVRLLLRAENWHEANRFATLHERKDLQQECRNSAEKFVQSSQRDLNERKDLFQSACASYINALKRRSQAETLDFDMESPDGIPNDTKSVFSASSEMSNRSMLSVSSSESASLASGIGSAFSLSGEGASSRHKSKFNKIDASRRKKVRSKGKQKVLEGSEEALRAILREILNASIDSDFRDVIAETIEFMTTVSRFDCAKALYDSFVAAKKGMEQTHYHLVESIREDTSTPRVASPTGNFDELLGAELPDSLHCLFRAFCD